ncbi:hypothetical protein ACB092_05G234100 [Castanea dentata]
MGESANTKRQTLVSPEKAVAMVDRMSDLPESLMCHILWFLPTKEAVATSILSSSWKSLWKLVPRLDLDVNTIKDSWSYGDVSFQHIVSRVLAQQELLEAAPTSTCGSEASHHLQTLRLKCSLGHACSRLNTWLRAAAAREVKELDLEICYTPWVWGGEHLELARSVFSCCRTLMVLKLSGDIEIDIGIDDRTSSVQFPCLKILQLLEIIYTQEDSDSFSRLPFGCPVLEDLTFTINLVRVDYKTHDPDWHVLLDLLQMAPNLETLVVANKGYICFDIHKFCWKEPPGDDSDYLWPRLTSFYYRRFEGLKHEVDSIKYILKKARVLKRVTIQVAGRESKESVHEKISMFPRRSTCLLTVE